MYDYGMPCASQIKRCVLVLLYAYSKQENQANVIDSLNSTSRYLVDLLNIGNPYVEGTVIQIYPHELQFNKANTIDTKAPPPLFGLTYG